VPPRAARYSSEAAARRWLEKLLWPSGPVCPHCGINEPIYALESKPASSHPLRKGVYKCGACRRTFTVAATAIFRGSHIPLHKWLVAGWLMCSEKHLSALRLQQELQLGSYRSAVSLWRRIRWALATVPGRLRGADAVPVLFKVRLAPGMPRLAPRREKSVWNRVDQELHQPGNRQQERPGRF
jgi:transposase-like protein